MPTAQELRTHGYLPRTPFRHAVNAELRDLTPQRHRLNGVWLIGYEELDELVGELPDEAKENRIHKASDEQNGEIWYHESLVGAISLMYAAKANESPLSPDEIISLMGIVLGSSSS